ncbi:LysM peptidoglycan-binding domain-containing protein [Alkalihalobacterium alkalinitrilicum]|uniref:LysM peptidoglycan-binding domain-containing protein n=1 Tax=Alkalihalobacterium alkalinitrilicum TaxID=427920 RepID=UPI000994EAAA|nr:LysM peptidoglycan-binding domain-containing protein [Alkalihalobacterium alkalinitrilicum]
MSKKSNETFEFVPRSIKHKKRKRKRTSFIILAILLTLSIGVISTAVIKLEMFPQSQTGNIAPEQMEDEDRSSDDDPDESPDQTDRSSNNTDEEPLEENEDKTSSNKNTSEGGTKEVTQNEANQDENKSSSQIETKPKETNTTPKENKKQPADSKPELVIIHEVGPNETLYSITRKYYIDTEQQHKVAQFNGIVNPATDIKAGLQLKLPDTDIIAFHEVEKGETLFSITNKYYGNANELISLAKYNGIFDPSTDVKVGMKLNIPHPSILKNYREDGYTIKVSKTMNTLTVYRNSEVFKTFSVATGKDASLTPEGVYQIVSQRTPTENLAIPISVGA